MLNCGIMSVINFGADNMNNPVEFPDTTSSFLYFLQDSLEEWKDNSIEQKDRVLHEYLNIECGAGVFTDVLNETDIRIEYSYSKHVVINVMDDLATVSQKVDAFLELLGG